MNWLTQNARLFCDHMGAVANLPSQTWVRIDGIPVLRKPDPVGRPIAGCPNAGVGIKPCTATLKVDQGYSSFVRIDGKPVCLTPIEGKTDGTPPLTVEYSVQSSGQSWVQEISA